MHTTHQYQPSTGPARTPAQKHRRDGPSTPPSAPTKTRASRGSGKPRNCRLKLQECSQRLRRVPILTYQHTSRWTSAIEKPSEPLRVTFDAHGAAGRGVRHKDLASRGAAVMNNMIVRGGERVQFPTTERKIRFRIVVRYIGQSHTVSGQST